MSSMKKNKNYQLFGISLLALALLTVLASGSFSNAFGQTFEQDVILAKLTETAANELDIQIVNNIVQTGLPSLDALNQQHRLRSMKRILRDGGKNEIRHAQFGLTRYYKLAFDAGADVQALVQAYGADTNLESAQPNYKYKLFEEKKKSSAGPAFTPNDPQYPNQWHYNNTGQSGGTPDADIDLPEAWDIETGSANVIVSDLDTGQDLDHPDLAANIWVNTGEIPGNSIDDDANGYIDDVNGWDFSDNDDNPDDYYDHGSHTMGTVAAVTNNGVGVAGVAFGSTVMPCKIFPNAFDAVIAEAFTYAADNGSIVSTNSWGGGGQSNLIEDAIDYYLATTDGVVVFAAGNDNSSSPTLGYPASYPPVIAVAATNHNDQKAWYSNYGSWVDVSAPGGETAILNQGVLSTVIGGYGYFQGTSMACPHVAGIAALIFSDNPGITGADVRSIIESTTDFIDNLNPGFEGLLGTGRVNAFKALSGGPFPKAPTNLQAIVTNSDVDLTWTDPTENTDGSPINLDHITVYRNGSEIAQVGPGVQSYTDVGVPDGQYSYFVTATNVEGFESGPSNVENVVIGQIDALIWMHPDVGDPNIAEKARERGMTEQEIRSILKNPTSHIALQAALEANGKSVLFVPDITSVDLSQFEMVFVIAGAWPNNYRIPANGPEALAIENYILAGGKVNMEGNDVWYWDPKFGGHDFGPLFSLDGLADGGGYFGTIVGSGFAAGLDFGYNCTTSLNDVIGPLGPAFVIHSNQSPAFDCGVAFDEGTYKTIGVSHQFGCLVDGASTKNQLMAAYINFFVGGVANPPDIDVSPASFSFTVPEGGSDSGVMTISNVAPAGSDPLNWGISDLEATLLLSNGQQLPVKVKSQAKQAEPSSSEMRLATSSGAVALLDDPPDYGVTVPAGLECSDGEIHDDGTAENGYGWNPSLVSDGRTVELFNPGPLPFDYTQVCISWTRNGADSQINFNIQVYDDDGPGGEPGTLLASIPVTASGVPTWPTVAFYDFDVTGLVPTINNPSVYIGAQWNPMVDQNFFIAADESPTTPLQTGYGQTDFGGFVWTPLQDFFAGYKAMFIRAEGNTVADCPWLSEDPTGGSIPAGSSQDVDIIVDATGLAIGTYNCNLLIASNDPDEPVVTVPVTLNVEPAGTPDIDVNPLSFDVILEPGGTTTEILTIGNVGDGALNFSISEAEGTSTAQLQKAIKIIPRSTLKSGNKSSNSNRPSVPGSLSSASYRDGHDPFRDPYPNIPPPTPNQSTTGVLLLDNGGDPSEIQSFLDAFPDLSPVDAWDIGFAGTPTLPDLLAYDAVILMNNSAFPDPNALGDVLADYVDAGGGVTTTLASFAGGFALGGRFMSGGYSPFDVGVGPVGDANLGTFDPSHPVMQGVTSMYGDLLADVPLAAGATLVASWDSGLNCVGVKENVVAFNIFVSSPGFWSGDVPLLLHNAVLFSSGGAVPWLDEDPKSGTVAAFSSLPVDIIFDASELGAGEYFAHLTISSNDPDEPEVIVSPIKLTVATDAIIWIPPDVIEPNLQKKAAERGLAVQTVENMVITPNSHNELKAALEANGKTVQIVNELTNSMLANAQYLFVVLGIFPNNHVVKDTDPEAAIIENYIASSGNVYIEGGDAWYYDPQFLSGHDFGVSFSIDPLEDGADDLKSILGSSFAAGKDFTYSGQNNFIDHIAPLGPAVTIHANSTPAYDVGIAHDSPAGYRTIGNAFEFGGLDDASLSGSTKETLMAAYLSFFDTGVSLASALFDFPLQNGGWYLVSLPVTPSNGSVSALFPTAIAAFEWDFAAQTYTPATELIPERAYWLAMPAAATVEVFGQPLISYSKTYTQSGWDMIGSVMETAGMQSDPNGSVFAMFGYNALAGQYESVRNFEPKQGYWIAVTASEQEPLFITIGSTSASSTASAKSGDLFAAFGSSPPMPPQFAIEGEELIAIPSEYGLLQNYPNPFNPVTVITYQLPAPGHVSLKIYTILGREVRTLVDGEMPAGIRRVKWDARNGAGQRVESGVYIYRLQAGDFVQTKKLILVK